MGESLSLAIVALAYHGLVPSIPKNHGLGPGDIHCLVWYSLVPSDINCLVCHRRTIDQFQVILIFWCSIVVLLTGSAWYWLVYKGVDIWVPCLESSWYPASRDVIYFVLVYTTVYHNTGAIAWMHETEAIQGNAYSMRWRHTSWTMDADMNHGIRHMIWHKWRLRLFCIFCIV